MLRLSLDEDSNIYRDNKAAYGSNLASFVKSFSFSLTQGNETFESHENRQVTFAPGQVINFKIYFKDQEGRFFSDEQGAVASIKFLDDQIIDRRSSITGFEAIAVDGVINFPQLIIR